MRVTNGMMVNNLMRNLNRNLIRMNGTQQQLSSGKKFINPSDDPIGVSRSLRLNTEIAAMDQYKRNAEDVNSWLSSTEKAISSINDVLQRARELTVQAASDTNTVGERDAISKEIVELKNQLIQLGNTTYAGSYLFSGFKTDKALLKPDGTYDIGGGVNRLTLDENIKVNIGIGDKIGENFIGQRLFGLYTSAADLDMKIDAALTKQQSLSGSYISASISDPLNATGSFTLKSGADTVNIDLAGPFTSLTAMAVAINTQLDGTALDNPHVVASIKDNRLVFESDNILTIQTAGLSLDLIGMTESQTSVSRVDSGNKSQLIAVFDQLISDLGSGNNAGINKALTRLDIQMDNVNALRAEIGVKTNRLDLTINRIDDDTVNLTGLMSKNEDADIAEVIMNLKMEEYVYQASLSGGAKIIQPTLVDFIR